MVHGDKPKRQKDDMGNKGRRSGKGPKPMTGLKKLKKGTKRSARIEKRAIKRVEKLMSDDMGNIGRRGKGPKPMSSNQLPESLKAELVKTTGEAMAKSLQKMVHKKAGGMIKPEDPAPVTRYQGSTPKIGGNKKIEQISNEQKSYGQRRSEELREAHEGYTGSTTDQGIEARYGKAAAQKKK